LPEASKNALESGHSAGNGRHPHKKWQFAFELRYPEAVDCEARYFWVLCRPPCFLRGSGLVVVHVQNGLWVIHHSAIGRDRLRAEQAGRSEQRRCALVCRRDEGRSLGRDGGRERLSGKSRRPPLRGKPSASYGPRGVMAVFHNHRIEYCPWR
jgi:hypothetical protein